MDPADRKSLQCPELKSGSRKSGRCSALPFSGAPPCSCWRAGRHVPPKSCPPLRARFRAPGMNSDCRSLNRTSTQSSREHLVISPGYCMTRCKEKIAVTLDEDFFGCFLDEKPKSPCPTRLEVNSDLEDTVNDLQEQISKLITMLEQERRDHRETQKNMKALQEGMSKELQQKCGAEVRRLQEAHAAELQVAEAQWKSTLEEQQAKMDKKIAILKEDYEHLQISFRAYKASLLEEMEEKWRKRESSWRETQEEEKNKALMQQSAAILKDVEKEKNDVWLNAQKTISTMHFKHSEEIESLLRKYEGAQEATQVQEKLKEKMDLLDAQKDCAAKLKREEVKHKEAMQAVMHANTELRRKLTVRRAVPTDPYVGASQSSSFDEQPCED
ncbi:hypothetical protein NDU88_003309 [Pleurodeles waltl]|uniref:Uncharacterized protein n=1 Tax=Pleurodeles waltl TaxID=8319 RepID=A0AAV7UC57_PLEWA|nr:hypothetical protein NDU88_003309 [Pleurodeles waltl]